MKTESKSPVRTMSTPHLAPASWLLDGAHGQSPKRKTNMIASMFHSATSGILTSGSQPSSLSEHQQQQPADSWRDHHHGHAQRSSSIGGFLSIKQRGRMRLLRQASAVSDPFISFLLAFNFNHHHRDNGQIRFVSRARAF